MNATHTPGPWTACPGLARTRYRIETRGTGNDCDPIAECKGPDREANARLIAAAPEMLAALKSIAAGQTQDTGQNQMGAVSFDFDAAKEIARMAIAKATR